MENRWAHQSMQEKGLVLAAFCAFYISESRKSANSQNLLHLTLNQRVVGSSPTRPTNRINGLTESGGEQTGIVQLLSLDRPFF